MLKQVAIVIPFYRDSLSAYDKVALQQCESVLSAHPKIAIKPHSLTLPEEASMVSFTDVVSFDDHYFNGIAGYNHLMLSSCFYEQFLDYDFVLIYQMDCFVFKDELSYWCNESFDYIGAPWIKKTYHKTAFELLLKKAGGFITKYLNFKKNDISNKYQMVNRVGNGGFSLRRVKKFHEVCIAMTPMIDFYLSQNSHYYNEDMFWSLEVNREQTILSIPRCEKGLKFAFEVPPVKASRLNDQNLPFGCHDWDKYADFWRPIFKEYNYNI